MIRYLASCAALLLVAACAAPPTTGPARPTTPPEALSDSDEQAVARRAARQFITVVEDMEPIAERACRNRTSNINCDFLIVVDDRPGMPPNAFQTLNRQGRPVIAFNLALIADARNADELAFILGHEAAHHIEGHLARQAQNATAGAVIFGGLASLGGASAEAVRNAQELGASVGARSYSKEFELEADRLGTLITLDAGYDPVRGADYFFRIPDPGDRFLGTHPPNAARRDIVRRTAAEARSS
ncbi:M48 family metallopeptidase [Pseudaestuariivita sp.]|uniref:M48 family metallopeptidase n=1 Tax=Pseudaestuariivita sp. TaxID=2211669 RepID=UPI00405956D2